MWRLRVVSGSASPATIRVTDGLTLGRSPESDVVFHDPLVSRIHARLVVRDDGVEVIDLGSANGTEQGGRRIDRARLAAGDRIRIGDAELVFEPDDGSDVPDAAPAPAPARAQRRSVLARTTVRFQVPARGSAPPSPADTVTTGDVQGTEAPDDAARPGPTASRLERFAQGAARFAQADVALVLVRRMPGGPHIVAGRFPADDSAEPPLVPRSLLARASRLGHALLLATESAEGRDPTELRPRPRASAMCAPIGGPAGDGAVVYVERRDPARPFTTADLEPLAGLAARAAPSLTQETSWFRWRAETECAPAVRRDAVLVGDSPAFLAMLDVAEHVAAARAPVLVRGESGSGRRLLARLLHERSRVRKHPFVVVSAASLPPGDEVAALVGEAAGGRQRPGLLEDVGFGTLCVAEVADLAPAAQAVLSQALAASRYTPQGSAEPRNLRCRIVATTSRSLDPLAAAGSFEAALAAALSGVTVGVPPLAERGNDLRLLAEHFAAVHGRRCRGHAFRITSQAHTSLARRTFRDNVAELSNVVERAVLRASSDELEVADFEAADPPSAVAVTGLTLELAERAAIVRALDAAGGRKGRAAEILGISWPTLTRKIREYKIE